MGHDLSVSPKDDEDLWPHPSTVFAPLSVRDDKLSAQLVDRYLRVLHGELTVEESEYVAFYKPPLIDVGTEPDGGLVLRISFAGTVTMTDWDGTSEQAQTVISNFAVNGAENSSSSYWVTEGWRTRTTFTGDAPDLGVKSLPPKLPVRVRPADSGPLLLIAIGDDIGRDLILSRDARSEAIVPLDGDELSANDFERLTSAIGTGKYRYSRIVIVTSSGEDVPTSLLDFLTANYGPIIEQGQVATCAMPYRESDARPLHLT